MFRVPGKWLAITFVVCATMLLVRYCVKAESEKPPDESEKPAVVKTGKIEGRITPAKGKRYLVVAAPMTAEETKEWQGEGAVLQDDSGKHYRLVAQLQVLDDHYIVELAAGKYWVMSAGEELLEQNRMNVVVKSGEVTRLDFHLESAPARTAGKILGRIEFEKGDTVWVFLDSVSFPPDPWSLGTPKQVDSQTGAFEFTGVAPGAYGLTILSKQYGVIQTVDMQIGNSKPLTEEGTRKLSQCVEGLLQGHVHRDPSALRYVHPEYSASVFRGGKLTYKYWKDEAFSGRPGPLPWLKIELTNANCLKYASDGERASVLGTESVRKSDKERPQLSSQSTFYRLWMFKMDNKGQWLLTAHYLISDPDGIWNSLRSLRGELGWKSLKPFHYIPADKAPEMARISVMDQQISVVPDLKISELLKR